MQRACGILLPLFSLPGPGGIGSMGKEAYAFVDALQRAGQSYWQLLPLSPLGPGNSPYNSVSAFAGETLLIDLPLLYEDGLLTKAELTSGLANCPAAGDRVSYQGLAEAHAPLLQAAYRASQRNPQLQRDIADFREANAAWLPDYALFQVISQQLPDTPLGSWPMELRRRQPAALEAVLRAERDQLAFHYFLQQQFASQWQRLHDYARSKNIAIIGDLPIYIAPHSADLWAHPELFCADGSVAGCPPDYFCAEGQLWGNPLYDWQAMAADGYAWWLARLRHNLQLFDWLRLDHFRGFSAYWAVPAAADSAAAGSWQPGPGTALFQRLADQLGELPLLAEDLGTLDEEFFAFHRQLGFPGMQVLQFAFEPGANSSYLPHNAVHNAVVYTGTHDNDTSAGWFAGLPAATRAFVEEYLGPQTAESIVPTLIRTAYASVAELAIVPMQDVLALPTAARTNTPGTPSGNWRWRLLEGQFSEAVQERLAAQATVFGRAAKNPTN